MEKNPEKYLDTLNTFDGITLGYKCMHTEGVEPIKLQELYPFFLKHRIKLLSYRKNISKIPIFKFNFSNQRIVEDTFSFLCFHVNNYHLTMNEKVFIYLLF